MKYCYVLILMVTLYVSSCTSDSLDCVCTDDFRSITVVVVDTLKSPVNGLISTIEDESGKMYSFPQEPPFFPGLYTIMNDSYVHDFSTVPKTILFTAENDSLAVSAQYLINTDPCMCHINKVSGPDTLVLR